MSDSRERFMDLLKDEILQLDQPDLDFGIYRILNYRRAEIEHFFDDELPSALEEAVAEGSTNAQEGQPEQGPFAESELDRLYNHLYIFFSRYYRDGDFEPQPRRARNARYSVPYNGEDVHFYWRSFGSHYIKTSEELRSYRFKSGKQAVRFELVDAYQEPDNVKGTTRYFMPIVSDCQTRPEPGGPVFVVPFAFHRLKEDDEKKYGARSEELDGNTVQERIISDLAVRIETPQGVAKTDLLSHMRRYAAKARRDYFVHPDLGPFLRDELDYYLKNEVLDIDGLSSKDALHDRLVKLQVLREVGRRVIGLLDGLESIQLQLFEKRRFVLSCGYLVQLGLVPTSLLDDVASNAIQIEKWRPIVGSGSQITRDTLESHPELVLDTRLFSRDFQMRLVSQLDDMSELLDGLAIKAENYGALRTIAPSFRGRVAEIYIDPPYNTGKDDFLYKDDFQRHSAWLTMMRSRMEIARGLLRQDGLFVSSISDVELARLRLLGDGVFGSENWMATFIWNNEGNIDNQSRIKVNHEYLLAYAREEAAFEAPCAIDPSIPSHSKLFNDTIANSITKNGPKNPPSEVHLPAGFPADFEEGDVDPDPSAWPRLSNRVRVRDGRTLDDVAAFSGWSSNALLLGFIQAGFKPVIDRKGVKTWFRLTATGAIYQFKERTDTQSHVLTVIRGVGTTKQMSSSLKDMGLTFTYPKPVGLMEYVANWHNDPRGWYLDFFAGSGTSAHAIINVNRKNPDSHRRFIAIEMGEHFDSVLIPRIGNVTFCSSWKGGEPEIDANGAARLTSTGNGGPRLVKVLALESYEDALGSLSTSDNPAPQLGWPLIYTAREGGVTLDTRMLERPFSLTMDTKTENGVESVPVDLPETFNLIAGIEARKSAAVNHGDREYRLIAGTQADQNVLVVWREVDGLDPAAELAFLRQQTPALLNETLDAFDCVWHNADSVIPNGRSLDAEFHRLMFETESEHS